MKTKISVVTPTFNRRHVLEKNFNSLLLQSVQIYEHVIVDNNSSDGTKELVEDYINEAPYPVKYMRETDTGIYNAMNKGIKECSGEWIFILNSDDYLLNSTSVERVCKFLIPDNDIVLASIVQLFENGERKEWLPSTKEWRIPHPGVFVQKKYYDKVGLYSEKYRIVSDAIWKFKNVPKSNYCITNECVTVMVDGGISSLGTKELYWENFKCILFYQPLSLKRKLSLALKYYKKYRKAKKSQ